jgi:DNA primase
LGFCRGDALAQELRRRGISLASARALGLLVGPELRERFAGRIIIPELRKGQPIWMTGRRIDDTDSGKDRYMSLPGPRPLLGKDWISGHARVYGSEGVFDWLTLLEWGFPAFGWLGGALSSLALTELEGIPLIYVIPDGDHPGQRAGSRMMAQLGRERARIIPLPRDTKDLNDLAQQPGGKARFLAGLRELAQRATGTSHIPPA